MNIFKISINNIYPIFLIKFIHFSVENRRLYSNLNQLKRYVILVSLEAIWVYCFSHLEEIFKIINQFYKRNSNIKFKNRYRLPS